MGRRYRQGHSILGCAMSAVTGITTDGRVSLEERLVYFDDHFNHLSGRLLFWLVVERRIDHAVPDYVTHTALEA